jgi:hypothetical protein
MKNLITMTDFVLEQIELNNKEINDDTRTLDIIDNYANFLKTPLKLEMFVPCDEDGNVLITPTEFNPIYWSEQYKKAKEKVLFDDFEVKNHSNFKKSICTKSNIFHVFCYQDDRWVLSKGIKIIEDLARFNLELTKNFKT